MGFATLKVAVCLRRKRMDNLLRLNLQLFSGEGDGGGEGAATGAESAVDAGQQRLRELGVPEDKLRKRAQRNAANPARAASTTPPAQEQTQEHAADADHPAEEQTEGTAPSRMTWEQIMEDPEYNKQMQAVVQGRLRSAKAAEESLKQMTPALELLARKHGLDSENINYQELSAAISAEDEYYEDKALEMGVSVDTAKRIDQEERNTARAQREEAATLETQKIQQHIASLEQQGEAMKAIFPSFDLRKELQNPAFARMTSPNVGISVEDAYYAVHRNEIQSAAMQVTAQQTARKISNSIQAGQRRPAENGTTGQSPSAIRFDYRNASPDQRAALKKRIRDAAARGEKVYPGQ